VKAPGFWTGALDRALKSFAQTLLVLWGSSDLLNIFEVNWLESLGIGAGALVLSLLTSLASSPVGDDGTTSMLRGGS
jgi:Putative lactococcus lactis phage r1t holin